MVRERRYKRAHQPDRSLVPGESMKTEPIPAKANRINVYVCPKCDGYTVTIDIHVGVTPFMLRCRASGKEGDCDGMAESSLYPEGPPPPWIPDPSWEWFKPVGSEYRKLSRDMKEHVDKGGLDLRKRK